ncbi:hypothetical protein CLV51_107127 [Chitinophaga niastensis]|uniref:Uncharacterized protein n=1 Tax=Chitinophaga niastensis TaxID=536980 RepID=A0A2P8HC53_CHINA|nr:hypothetical protein [Chitinophaga niastensis]PSL43816.1 hypothetical protein CLV51_107127 [Chitinophaga niastensis]
MSDQELDLRDREFYDFRKHYIDLHLKNDKPDLDPVLFICSETDTIRLKTDISSYSNYSLSTVTAMALS